MKVTKVEPIILEAPVKEPWRIGTAVYTSMHAALVRIETDEAERLAAQGFPAMKLKIGQGGEADVRNVREIRRALGDRVQLMTDANCAYDTLTALQLGRRLEAEGVAWFEEPVAPENLDGYAKLAQALDLPIAGGESEFTRWAFKELFVRQAIDIIQPDLGRAGGFTESRRRRMPLAPTAALLVPAVHVLRIRARCRH